MKMETVDLKLLQALIGTRLPIGLSLYCSNFLLSRIVISQAKYQAYSALLNVLQDYQKPEREIFIDGIKESINRQINGNEDRLRQNALLPSSSSNLKSLTDSSCSDIKSYVQETDISNLCTFSVRKVIEIYHNYLSCEEVQNLESVLLKAKEIDDKYSYIESKKGGYHFEREEALKIINSNEPLLLEIQDRTFFDDWYEGLLHKVLCEAEKDKKHILYGEIIEKGFFIEEKINSAKIKLGSSFNKEVIKRVISQLLDEILSDSPVIKESLLSSMKCIDIDSYKGRMNYEAVNHRIISRANELISSYDMISQANLGDSIEERGLQHIVNNMHVSLLSIVEQEILNEIAKKAANHREKDNKKRDLELLVICNGGEFQNALSLPSSLGFSEIERLYEDMLSIEFIKKGEREQCSLFDRLPLLELEEIKEAFPTSITSDILELANGHWFLGVAYTQPGQYQDAISNMEKSIKLCAKISQYYLLEVFYQQLAWVRINSNTIQTYINSHRSIIINNNANDIDKLCSHLALAGLYRVVRQQELYMQGNLNDINFQESFHYSEAYKFIQGPLDNSAYVVLQREMGIADNKNIGTYNIQQCVAVIAYDPNIKKVVLSHFDRFSGPLKFIDQILAQFSPEAKIDIYLSGGRDHNTYDDSKRYVVSDNNIDQVLKQIFHYRERFNIKSTDIGSVKPSPAGIVFDVRQEKLIHSTPNLPDTSLISRTVGMFLQLNKFGDYLQPINEVDFSQSEESRIVRFDSDKKLQISNLYGYYNNLRVEGNQNSLLMWFYNQVFYPLLSTVQDIKNIQNSDIQQIIQLALKSRGNFDNNQIEVVENFNLQLLQQGSRQQNLDTVDVLHQQRPATNNIDVQNMNFNFAGLSIDDACLSPPASKRPRLNKRNAREKRATIRNRCLQDMDEEGKVDKEKTGIDINYERFDESKVDSKKLKTYSQRIEGQEKVDQLNKLILEIQQAQTFRNFNNLVKKVHKHLPKDLDVMMPKESLNYFLQIYKINFLRSILPIIHNKDFKNLLIKSPMWLIKYTTSEGKSLLDDVFIKIQGKISAKYDGVFTTSYQDFEELENTINQELSKYSRDIKEAKDISMQYINKSDLLCYVFKSLGLALLMEGKEVPVDLQGMVHRDTLINLGMLVHDYKGSIPESMKNP